MSLPKVKGLTATTIAVLLSTGVGYPAIALGEGQGSDVRPPDRLPEGQLISQMYVRKTIRGTIALIDGDEVTLQMPNGQTQRISVAREEQQRLNLRPGMELVATVDGSALVQSLVVVQRNVPSLDTANLDLTARPIVIQTQPAIAGQATIFSETPGFDDSVPIRGLW